MDVSSVTDSLESARTYVKAVETAFGTGDVDQMIKGFTEDVVVRFADRPEMHGIAEVEAFLRLRMARQKNYRLKNKIAVWEATFNVWEAGATQYLF